MVHNEIDANFTGWWHATLGSPTISALLGAIQRGALRNVPRLTTKIVRRNPPRTMATALGHLDLTRAHIRSTNPRRHTKVQKRGKETTETSQDEEQLNDDKIYVTIREYSDQEKHDQKAASTI